MASKVDESPSQEYSPEVRNGGGSISQHTEADPPATGDALNPYGRMVGLTADETACEDGTDWFFATDEGALRNPVVILPWRMALLLFVSTLAQNFSYESTSYFTENPAYMTWTDGERQQYSQLVFNMIYLGPVFGLIIDIVRLFGERYRAIMIVAAAGNAVLCFTCFGVPTFPEHYGRSLVVAWLIQILVMFMYIPATSMVIAYGNSYQATRAESSARIGGLMAQTMFVRSFSTFISTFVTTFAADRIAVGDRSRYMVMIGAICSCLLILLLVIPFTIKRSYFLDRGEHTFVHAAPKRFVLSTLRAHRDAFSDHARVTNTSFMSVVVFSFVYFLLPDVLYNDTWKITSLYGQSFPRGLTNTISCLAQLGACIGALLYALWMYTAQRYGGLRMRFLNTTPYAVVLAGCCAWGFGTFFYMFGVLGHHNEDFSWDIYLPFQSIIVQACLRFAFMPMLSLVSMHSPSGYPSTAFQLFSVASTGGGSVSGYITAALGDSMGTNLSAFTLNMSTYWKTVLLCIFFHFVMLLPALSLPKCRAEDETKLTRYADENVPLQNTFMEEMNTRQ